MADAISRSRAMTNAVLHLMRALRAYVEVLGADTTGPWSLEPVQVVFKEMGKHPGFAAGTVAMGGGRVLRTTRLRRFLTNAVIGSEIAEILIVMSKSIVSTAGNVRQGVAHLVALLNYQIDFLGAIEEPSYHEKRRTRGATVLQHAREPGHLCQQRPWGRGRFI